MVYDEQTIREAFRKCVGFADGVNKISDFPSVTPASSDKILIEQGGNGKSATLADLPIPTKVQSGLDTKINYTDSLSYEEITATNANLTNKVSSASALKTVYGIVKNKLHDSAVASTFDSVYSDMKTGMTSIYVSGVGDFCLIQIYRTDKYGCQIRMSLNNGVLEKRFLLNGTWSSWATV